MSPITFMCGGMTTPPPFNPTSLITGQGGFWRADMGVTQAAGLVSQWNDQSSFGNNMTSPTGVSGTVQPNYSSTGFNSAFPAVTTTNSSGTNYGMSLASSINFNSTTCTCFFLCQWNAASGATYGRFVGLWGSGSLDFNDTRSFEIDDNGGGSPLAFGNNNNSVRQGNGGAVGPNLTAGNLYLFGLVFDGANANIWSAGSVIGSGTANTNTLGGGAGAGFAFGHPNNSPPTGASYAFIGLTYKAMNSVDWTNLKNWSNSNWGTSF